jgi:BASS family bile acid:Na+ symporter
LRATVGEALSLFRRFFHSPYQLPRALLAMYVLVPLVATIMTLLLDLEPPVEIAMLAMAVSPVPPILPGKQLRFGGRADYVIGLWVAVSISAFVVVPLAVQGIGLLFGREARIGFAELANPIGLTILLPLVAGMIARRFLRDRAVGLGLWIGRLATLLLVCAFVPILASAWPAMVALVGNGTFLGLAAMAGAAMAIGHGLGGPDPNDRTALAIASAIRHPGIALAIVTSNFPEEPRALAAMLMYILVGGLMTTIYGARRRDAKR